MDVHRKREVINAFRDAFENDKGIYEKWVQYAEKLVRVYNKKEVYFQGHDVVAELVQKTIEGVRIWDMERVSLNKYMYRNIESIISNKSQREYKKAVTKDNYVSNDEEGETLLQFDNLLHTDNSIIENEFTRKEFFELLEEEIMNPAKGGCSADNGCIELYFGIRENSFDHTKNKEISEVLGMDMKDVENLKKRFMRHCDNVYLKFYGNPPKEQTPLFDKTK